MPDPKHLSIKRADSRLASSDLDGDIEFFRAQLGLRLDSIFPADYPHTALLSGGGLSLRLERTEAVEPGLLTLTLAEHSNAVELPQRSPGGTQLRWVLPRQATAVPGFSRETVISRVSDNSAWITGRASMQYRDLLPSRLGGAFIASHIRIPNGGEVPDYVHYHHVRFQMIYCYRGWVKVVYEDQGPAFVMHPGDCVLQPPGIRHQVLECSAGLEVVEIGCPAEHETWADHDLPLPNDKVDLGRTFQGQTFLRHQARHAPWRTADGGIFEERDLGMEAATDGLAHVSVHRWTSETGNIAATTAEDASLHFRFVLAGAVMVKLDNGTAENLEAGDCFALPANECFELKPATKDLELLVVQVGAIT